eukprot:ANDGO_02594.mRNA.1 hypothetical protein GUITHDRAFT_102279
MVVPDSERVVLSRDERKRKYGFDCPDELHWEGWVPGGDYTLPLSLKNVSKKTQTIKYVLPDTKFFFLRFPEPIPLAAGMESVVSVSFRPIEEDEYIDLIEFQCPRGSFFVRVRATLPKMDVSLDGALDFGLCPVHVVSKRSIKLTNTGEKPLTFQFSDRVDGNTDFDVSPKKTGIAPGNSSVITVSLLPKDASVLLRTFHIGFQSKGEFFTRTLRVSAISKYPFLKASVERIDFGDVLPFQTKEYMFNIRNHSLVNADFRILPISRGCPAPGVDSVFRFEPAVGQIPPDSVMTFKAFFTPVNPTTRSSASFRVITPPFDENPPATVELSLVGQAVPPCVSLSPDHLSFGDVPLNERKVKVVHLKNDGEIPVAFSLDCYEESGSFLATPSSGVISPLSQVSVSFAFTPLVPVNFYRRVFVSFFGCADPLYVDLVGTSFDPENRPLPLLMKHVSAYRSRGSNVDKALLLPQQLEQLQGPKDEPVFDNESNVQAIDELFGFAPTPVRVKTENGTCLSFGSVSRFSATSSSKSVTVESKADGKLQLTWVCPRDARSGRPVFDVQPPQADLPPHGSVTFRVYFRPEFDTQYFAHELECYASWKVNRSFRLVTDKTLVPPWCIRLAAVGDTFPAGSERMPPSLKINPSEVVFAPLERAGHKMHVVVLENSISTPCQFTATIASNSSEFRVSTQGGLVLGNSRFLVPVMFNPSKSDSLGMIRKGTLELLLNAQHRRVISLIGIVSPQEITLEKNSLIFPPTFVGATAKRSLRVFNVSCVPSTFSWKFPSRSRNIITVVPAEGKIMGRDSVSVDVIFRPSEPETTEELAILCNREELRISGTSSFGVVSLEPQSLEFGPCLLGAKSKRPLTMLNHADCPMRFRFTSVDQPQHRDYKNRPTGLFFSEAEGTIPARSSKTVYVILRPSTRGPNHLGFVCEVGREGKFDSELRGSVSATGEHPLLQICDVFSNREPSTQRIWENTSAAVMNDVLASAVQHCEYTVDGTLPFQKVVETLESFDVDLGTAALNATAHTIVWKVKNCGLVSAPFEFRLPTDSDVEVEQWADKEELTERDLLYRQLVDDKIIHISPRSGVLSPGNSVEIKLEYAFSLAPRQNITVHELPVLLNIRKGKRIVMNLRGRTLLPLQRCLFVHPQHRMCPVLIGDRSPPVQYWRVDNPTDETVTFRILCAQGEEYGFEVLRCLDSDLLLGPCSHVMTRWVFQPLEAKRYSFPVVLQLLTADKVLDEYRVAFHSEGLLPASAGSCAEFYSRLSIPVLQEIAVESQPLVFAPRLSIFDCETFAKERRLVCVRNTSSFTYRISSSFVDDASRGDEVFALDPPETFVPPHESAAFGIILNSGAIPQTGVWDLMLDVENYTRRLELEKEAEADDDEDENEAERKTEARRKNKLRSKKRKSVVDNLTVTSKARFAMTTGLEQHDKLEEFDRRSVSERSSATTSVARRGVPGTVSERSFSVADSIDETSSVVSGRTSIFNDQEDQEDADVMYKAALTVRLEIRPAKSSHRRYAEPANLPLGSSLQDRDVRVIGNVLEDVLGSVMLDPAFSDTLHAIGSLSAALPPASDIPLFADIVRQKSERSVSVVSEETVLESDRQRQSLKGQDGFIESVLEETLTELLMDAIEGKADVFTVPRRIRVPNNV